MELRQNNEVLEAQSRDVWVDRRAATRETMALNPDLLELLIKAADATEPLTHIERQRVRAMGMRTFAIWEDYKAKRASPDYRSWFEENIIDTQ